MPETEREYYCTNCQSFKSAFTDQQDIVCLTCSTVIATFRDVPAVQAKREIDELERTLGESGQYNKLTAVEHELAEQYATDHNQPFGG